MTNLLLLPNELTQHIASFLPCSSALSLSRANRQLRTICNDDVVFHNIAQYDLGQYLLSENGIELSETHWAETDSALAKTSLQETIRIAYAAERCIKALLETGDAWTLLRAKGVNTYELSRWLPHIMALHHPVASQLKPETFLELQGRLQVHHRLPIAQSPQWYSPNLLDVNFILGYTILTQLHMTGNGKQVKAPFDRFFSVNHIADPPISLSNGIRVDGDAIKSLRQRVPNYGHLCKPHGDAFTIDQATTLLSTLILELAVHHLAPGHMSELPSPTKIPFRSFMHLPRVFGKSPAPVYGDSHEPFGMCHTQMFSSNFLSSGRWMGYYSDQRRALGRRRFGPPMHSVRFIARETTEPERDIKGVRSTFTIIDVQSRGTDAVGDFSLEGRVRHIDGYISLTKRYLSKDLSWEWEANMTPFGMVGAWGNYEGRFGGYFWIWKEEWRCG
ncbi:hypothetical protein BKA58DRAFT_379515 [Alternaria rosae]|uniref:uncharacterized protein n=1 Tax=Alternaria rosae TaxID=1187941 RepID=UPI001E8E01B1|nr:uncharacterized protein BKA58DRAFT_379515 [Alternaria rosae]KAH6875268.1 hypothetical protein BKA58DRAFT_379515 [Alternaria rosae]